MEFPSFLILYTFFFQRKKKVVLFLKKLFFPREKKLRFCKDYRFLALENYPPPPQGIVFSRMKKILDFPW
jgi:hypothetical protein